jgi:hypothetical protein
MKYFIAILMVFMFAISACASGSAVKDTAVNEPLYTHQDIIYAFCEGSKSNSTFWVLTTGNFQVHEVVEQIIAESCTDMDDKPYADYILDRLTKEQYDLIKSQDNI